MRTPGLVIVALLITAACGGGGKEETAEASAAPQEKQARTACAMITAAEMSAMVGSPLSSESEEGVGTTTCRYKPASSSSPFVEVKIDWGNGAVAMMASGLLSRLEPGISDRLEGIGDQASAAGPVLMIRTGEDLVNLTIWGVDDHVATAKRIINQIRPRMGPSAQSQTRPSEQAAASELPHRAAAPAAPVADEEFAPASGPSMRIPLVAGLTLVGAENEPRRGDYEPIVTITAVEGDMVSTVFSANLPEGTRLSVDRQVRRGDLEQARGFRSWYEEGDPPVFAGTTSFSLSSAVFNDLKTKGRAPVVRMNPDRDPLAAIVSLVASGGEASTEPHRGMLERIEAHSVAFPLLVNNTPAELPAIHARGTFDDATIDFHVLDDPDNPLILRVAGGSTGRIVRIAFPAPSTAPIEETLKKEARVELHGIYFDFGKDTIRPESEPVLRDVASALAHNPGWKIGIEGHTDNIGADDANLDLSRRRAAAVKQALVGRYSVPAEQLTTAGFGASRPNASNDTMAGRSRNRRVELVRQ